MANENEVKQPGQTGADPSPAENAPAPEGEQVKNPQETLKDGSSPKDNKIPYEKYKEIVDEKNALKELLDAKSYQQQEESEPEINPFQNQYVDEEERNKMLWKQYIEETADKKAKAVETKMENERKKLNDEWELKDLAKDNDFPLLKDYVKELVKSNPALSYTDAFDLAKFRSGRYEKPQTEEANPEDAQTGTPTPSVAADTIPPEDIIMAKNPDGTYKYSIEDIEKMLAKK